MAGQNEAAGKGQDLSTKATKLNSHKSKDGTVKRLFILCQGLVLGKGYDSMTLLPSCYVQCRIGFMGPTCILRRLALEEGG